MVMVGETRVEVEFWHAMGGALGEITAGVVEKFNNSQNEYYVKATHKGSYIETMSAAIAAYRAGEAPHIVQVYEVGTGTMIAAGEAIYPVHELMVDTGVPFDPQVYIAPVKGYYSFADGRMASMPFNSSTAVLWYNKDIFRRLGFDPTQPPKTWPELRDVARKIASSGAAKIGFSCTWLSWTQFEQFAAIHDLPFATKTNGFEGMDAELLLDHPLFLRHVQTLIDMKKEGSFTYGGRDSAPGPLFLSQEAALLMESSALLPRAVREAQFDWGITYMPYYDDFIAEPKNSIIGGASLWVMKRPDATPEHYKAVAEFFRFLSQPENDADWHMATGYVPVTVKGYEVAQARGHYQKNPGADIPILQLMRPGSTPNTRGLRLGNLPSIRVAIYEEVEKALEGAQGAEETIKNIVERGNAILREFEAMYQ